MPCKPGEYREKTEVENLTCITEQRISSGWLKSLKSNEKAAMCNAGQVRNVLESNRLWWHLQRGTKEAWRVQHVAPRGAAGLRGGCPRLQNTLATQHS